MNHRTSNTRTRSNSGVEIRSQRRCGRRIPRRRRRVSRPARACPVLRGATVGRRRRSVGGPPSRRVRRRRSRRRRMKAGRRAGCASAGVGVDDDLADAGSERDRVGTGCRAGLRFVEDGHLGARVRIVGQPFGYPEASGADAMDKRQSAGVAAHAVDCREGPDVVANIAAADLRTARDEDDAEARRSVGGGETVVEHRSIARFEDP